MPNLAPLRRYFLACLAVALAACAQAPDNAPPLALTSTSPAAGASGVSRDASLTLTFSRPVSQASLRVASAPVVQFGAPSWPEPNVAVLTPKDLWPAGTTITLTLAATDTAGGLLRSGTTLTFSTAMVVTDDDPPAAPTGVVATPQDGGFHLAWDLGTEPDLAGYQLQWGPDQAAPSSGVFVPVAGHEWAPTGLANGVKVYYRLQAVDTSGNYSAAASGDVTPTDMAPPTLTASTPADGSDSLTAVPFLRLVFSEPMDPSTLAAAYCEVPSLDFAGDCPAPTTALGGAPALSDGGTTARWETTGVFQPGSAYRVLPQGADLAGNALASGTRPQFKVAVEPDVVPPTVTGATYELDAAANTLAITVGFSEPMDQATTRAAFGSQPALACSWAWPTTASLRCTARSGLQQNTSYRLVVATSATDLAGNPLAAPWTEDYATPNLHPRLVRVTPEPGDFNVGYTTPIVFTFSEPMNPATLAYSVVRQSTSGDVALAMTPAFENENRVLRLSPNSAYPGSATIRWTITALSEAGGQYNLAVPATGTFVTRLVVGP